MPASVSRLSDETRQLLVQLEQNWLQRLASKRELVARIGEEGEIAAIPRLLPYVFDKARVADATTRAIASLLSRARVSELPWLDVCIRERVDSARWHALDRGEIQGLAELDDASRGLSLLLTCHRNGFVREHAVSRLEEVDSAAELAFLLIRLNDWVPPVRELAAELVRQRVRSDSARAIVATLPLVLRLRRLRRVDHGPIVEALLTVLREPSSESALRGGMGSSDRQVRREAFDLGSSLANADGFVADAIVDPDPLLRVRAARRARTIFSGERLDRMLRRMEHDATAAVRREALEGYLDRRPELAEAKLSDCLLDTSRGLRDYCQFHLRTRFDHDAAVDYRRALAAKTPRLRESILGLGETGDSSDCALLDPYLRDPRSYVRDAAVLSLSRLAETPPVEALLLALKDLAPPVSRRAREALKRVAVAVPPRDLEAVCASARKWHVYRNALLVGARLSPWDSLPLLLGAARDGDPGRRALGRRLAVEWLARSSRIFVGPNGSQHQSCLAALEASREKLPAKLWSEIALALRTAAASN